MPAIYAANCVECDLTSRPSFCHTENRALVRIDKSGTLDDRSERRVGSGGADGPGNRIGFRSGGGVDHLPESDLHIRQQEPAYEQHIHRQPGDRLRVGTGRLEQPRQRDG